MGRVFWVLRFDTIGGRLFEIQFFSTEGFDRDENSPKAMRFWETFKLALILGIFFQILFFCVSEILRI